MPATPTEINLALHQRLNRAVDDGQAQEVPAPSATVMIDRFLANRRAGRPLLDGMTVFRGAQDPDVNAGTFDARFKHATPMMDLARGYAETANQGMGLVVPATQGLGMLAEYALPDNAQFVRNFGLEDQSSAASSVSAPQSLSVAQVQERLTPLIDAYAAANDDVSMQHASQALARFYRQYMYEVPVPVDQAPLRQWVVQATHDEAGPVRRRLIEHQDQGPVAQVMVDAVRERKLAVDAHTPARAAAALRRGGATGLERLDAFTPGLAEHLLSVATRIDTTLNALHDRAYEVPHASLSQALAWRRQAQHGQALHRLGNTGTQVAYTDPALHAASETLVDLDRIEDAAYQHRQRSHKQERQAMAREGLAWARELEQRQAAFQAAAEHEAHASAAFSDSRTKRDKGAQRLDELEQRHHARRTAGWLARLSYRWGEQSNVLAEIERRRQGLDAQERRVEQCAQRCTLTRIERDVAKTAVTAVADRLIAREHHLRRQHQQGDVAPLPSRALEQIDRWSVDDWSTVARDAHRALRQADQSIVQGRRAAARLEALAHHGLSTEPAALPDVTVAVVSGTVPQPPTVIQVPSLSDLRASERVTPTPNPPDLATAPRAAALTL